MGQKLNKDDIDSLQSQILRKAVLTWDALSDAEKDEAIAFAQSYKIFMDQAKTERESVTAILTRAIDKGFEEIETCKNRKKCYQIHRNKSVALAVMGKKSIASGLRIIAAHIDSPRLDLKPNPLYEEVDLSLLKTHYYGGIRKYQWLARPLAIHGKIITKSGNEIEIVIGESDDDPVFTIADLLPHLARKVHEEKKLSEAFEGEKLNIIIGSIPLGDSKVNERFKLNVLNLFHQKYGMIEEDFITAEIEVVPAGKARDVGIDRSLIGAYGQDDRACVFTAMEALMSIDEPDNTALVIFFDKEEVGSEGNTSAKSHFIEEVISGLIGLTNAKSEEKIIRKALMNSLAISADVNGAIDPDFQEVHEKRNAARIGYGICISKYTGSGGKYSASDASAEYMDKIRRIFNKNNVIWQAGGLGKVDQGGGGTVAKFLSEYGMEIVDCGPPLLSMHSPFEISSKADIYMSFKAYHSFFTDND